VGQPVQVAQQRGVARGVEGLDDGLAGGRRTGCGGAAATCPGRVRRAGAAGVAGVLAVRALLRVLVCVLFTAIGTLYPVRGG